MFVLVVYILLEKTLSKKPEPFNLIFTIFNVTSMAETHVGSDYFCNLVVKIPFDKVKSHNLLERKFSGYKKSGNFLEPSFS